MPEQKNSKATQTSLMKLEIFIVFVVVFLLVGAIWYLLHPPGKNQSVTPQRPFVVVLPFVAFPPVPQLTEGFLTKMEALGYKDGQTITYLRHDPIQPNPEGMVKVRQVFQDYIKKDVNLIVVSSNSDTQIAIEETKNAGKSTPIVALDITNPIDVGLAKSFSSSGNNFTGVYELRSESVGRLLDMMQKVKPGMKKLGYLSDGFLIPGDVAPGTDYLQRLRAQAKARGITLVEYTTTVPPGQNLEKELQRLLDQIKPGEVDAWTHIPGHFLPDQQVWEDRMARRARIMFASPTAIEVDPRTGDKVGLFSYGVNFSRKGTQGAVIADKVIKGTSPENIPLEPTDRYDLIINLKVAKEIGITVPAGVLELANSVIE